MENKFTNIKERVLLIAENKGVSKEIFFANIGMTYGSFKGEAKKTPLNSDAIANILTIYSDISATWLLTGKGSMLIDADSASPAVEPSSISTAQQQTIEAQQQTIEAQQQTIAQQAMMVQMLMAQLEECKKSSTTTRIHVTQPS
ncbi:hypothetical protein SAMN05421780_101584 [Flexibacter flexilis DSM 6793]|uniref:Bacteriophage CI repressor helix-turn-helix domain-containing protein n=1 Tax=Flexibacter flexilis DSM 6793 TaxID=927664 RepID=A0A1I1E277_9BACT|nr:hypothetical protein [Flexibacter flexilis]SFB81164.1 hypothetical protein SAMN05421780_101584 [Flexibacter flexilis DSM 6793]